MKNSNAILDGKLTLFDPNIIFDSNLDLDMFSRVFVTFVTSIRNQTCHLEIPKVTHVHSKSSASSLVSQSDSLNSLVCNVGDLLYCYPIRWSQLPPEANFGQNQPFFVILVVIGHFENFFSNNLIFFVVFRKITYNNNIIQVKPEIL